jgi:hypothetical protein
MFVEISAALASIRAGLEIVKGLGTGRDAGKIDDAKSQINSRFLEAQNALFAANERLQSLQDENRGLREEVTARRNWDQEKNRYELRAIRDGNVVYGRAASCARGVHTGRLGELSMPPVLHRDRFYPWLAVVIVVTITCDIVLIFHLF